VARIRSIRPEFWKSEAIACHDMFTRLVFIGLWNYVDDNGVGIDNWRLVAAELFPLEEDFATVSRDLRDSLARLADAGRITRYTVDGKRYFAVANWDEHQKVDRPGKARYPRPDAPGAAPTPPESRGNTNPPEPQPEPLATVSRQSRETPSTGEGEKGRRGEGENVNYPSLAALDDEPAETDPATGHTAVELFVVAESDIVTPDPNAGQLTREWIDYCTANGVKLTTTPIKRYGRSIKSALGQGFTPDEIKRALGQMFRDRVTSRPSLVEQYLIRVQQGPELPPERLTRHQADAERRAAQAGTTAVAQLYDTLTRPA
jgi:hypothetical protein